MSFSRSSTRRRRPGSASTTTMWIEFDPTSMAATFIGGIVPSTLSPPARRAARAALPRARRRGPMAA
jgi:hypothetical protein